MRKLFIKRPLAMLLCIVMVLSMIPVLPIAAMADNEFKVYSDSNAVSSVAVPRNGAVTLTAKNSDAAAFQWQIQAAPGLWVNIQGENEATINLRYAMVANLMTNGAASIRCVSGDRITDEITVTLDPAAPEFDTPAPSNQIIVQKEATVVEAPAVDMAALEAQYNAASEAADAAQVRYDAVLAEKNAAQKAYDEAAAAEAAAKAAYDAAVAPAETTAATEAPAESAETTETTAAAPAVNAEELKAAWEQASANTAAAKAVLDEKAAALAAEEAAYTAAMDALDAAEAKVTAAMSQQGYGVMAAAEADVPTTYTVVINYVFTDGKQAASPYTATVAAGSALNVTVNSPSVLGYAPDKATVPINVESVTENITETVIYQPALVNFTVKHYQQNLNDDHYTLVETETKTGYTESPVGGDLAKTPKGFYKLLYDEIVEIAADGSTEVEIYYDRFYFLMNFDLDGGYGVEPIYARYGTDIEVGTPSKAGYDFSGWDREIPATMPAENTTFKAQWTAGDKAKVTVILWGENADNEEYSYLSSYDIQRTPGETLTYDSLDAAVHTHGASCYPGAGTTANRVNGPDNPVDGLVYKGRSFSGSYSYIYIGGQWYNYNGTASNGDIVASTCGKMDSKLWQYAKSDTITVAADGSSVINVYYDRTQFTLTFHYNYSNRRYNSTGTITDKWGADISSRFLEMNTTAKGNLWSRSDSGDSPWTSYLEIMPSENRDYYCDTTSSNTQSAEYYTETLTSGQYVLEYTVDAYYSWNLTISEEDFYPMEGFTYDHGTDGDNDSMPEPGSYGDFDGAKFYYTRNSYKLEYMSSGSKLEDKTATVKYQEPLSKYNITPPYPDNLEPNAYTFEGWYTDQYFHNKVDWTTDTMPASDVMVYAHWVPVTHTVTFALDKNAQPGLYPAQTVPHGSKITAVNTPTNGSYTFVGWFYDDNGVEKAFDPANMPVNRDLNLYGKWSANTMVPYTIKYAVENGDVTLTYIADDTTGNALALTTKTFEAKTGDELKEGYQSGYFPKEASHSITMSADEGAKNEFTFIYVPKEKVPYTVRYLEEGTNTVLHDPKTVETRDAIVTETFEPVPGYMPDAYQKRLVLSADDEQNVIIFWYVKDSTHAPLHIVHYTQNIEGDGYTVYQESTDINALIGKTYSENALTIPGFEYNAEKSTASGTMTAAGLELKLFYDRIEYPYEFRFLEQGTDKVLDDPVTGTKRYQAQVTQNFKSIEGYHLVTPSPLLIQIAIEDPANVANKNVRTFYYQENDVHLNYVVVGPDGCGSVTPTSETVKAVTGTALGSTATASSNAYKFVGWFDNEACSGNPLSTEEQYVPTKEATELWIDGTTYYAKFEYNLTSMTITKKTDRLYSVNDRFIFDVSDGTNTFTIYLAGNASLTIGNVEVGKTYTVTERLSGTRYTNNNSQQTITLVPEAEKNVLSFANSLTNEKWLGDSDAFTNEFKSN